MRIRHVCAAPLWELAGILVFFELGIWLAGAASGSPGQTRLWLVQYAGFWPGLLGDWQPNYPLQPALMFASYWLIHAGPLHLIGNLGVIVWLSARLIPALRPAAILEIWAGAVFGGACVYGLLSTTIAPMIGASGGVFGLLGAYVVVTHGATRHRLTAAHAARRTVLACGLILALSLLDILLRSGALAWQAHLGGFLTGAALGWRREA